MRSKFTTGMLGVISLLIVNLANASTISLTPSASTVGIGDTFTLNITGSGFADGTTAGGANLTWDASVLELVSGSAQLASGLQSDGTGTGGTFKWEALSGSTSIGVLDVAAYFTDTDLFGNPFPVTGSAFDFMTLSFSVLAAPLVNPTEISISNSLIGGFWQSGLNTDITDVVYNNATVTVSAVPVPAAVWLFGSGLLGLVAVARRRAA